MASARELVFVYGTLRRGGSNHFRMSGSGFVAAATVRGRLYRIDWYPGLVLDKAGDEISGEVYAVGPERMDQLDEFEGGEYRRASVAVRSTSGETMHAWAWEWRESVEGLERITDGDWLGEHA
jgi:gamma-glutamylcyclotransferase (GGCT)/AIG2-like uncharacterized protein YtfP